MKTTHIILNFVKLAICYIVLFGCLLHFFDLTKSDYLTSLFKVTLFVWISTKTVVLFLRAIAEGTEAHDVICHLQILKFIGIVLMMIATAIQMTDFPYSFLWGILMVVTCVLKLWLSIIWDFDPEPAEV